jgi:hypothetical protein
MKAGTLLLALVLTLGANGCGGGSNAVATGTHPAEVTPSSSAQSAVAAAGAKTQGKESAKASFEATFTGGQLNGTMTGNGSFAKRKGHLTLDMSGLSGGTFGNGKAELIFDGLVYYMKLPPEAAAQIPGGKQWFKMDLAKLGKQTGLNLEQLTQLNQSDPSQALDFIRSAARDFREVGSEEVRGMQTTHYKGSVDLTKVAADAPADVKQLYDQLLRQSTEKTVPMDVWIDGDGLVRKIRFTQKLAGGSIMTMDEELYEFGTQVDTTPPPASQVLDLTELLANS